MKRSVEQSELMAVSGRIAPVNSTRAEDMYAFALARDRSLSRIPADIVGIVHRLINYPRLLAIGGFYLDRHHDFPSIVYQADLSTAAPIWREHSQVNFDDGLVECVHLDNFFSFGWTPKTRVEKERYVVFYFDYCQNRWSRGRFPNISNCLSVEAVVIQNNIFLFSKYKIDKLEIDEECIKNVSSSDSGRALYAISSYDHYAVRVGGVLENGLTRLDYMQNSDCFDTIAMKWLPPVAMNFSRQSHTSTITGRQIYTFGGTFGNYVDKMTILSSAECLDLRCEKWNTLSEMPTPLQKHAAVEIDDNIILISGGYDSVIARTDNNYECYSLLYDIRADRYMDTPEWKMPDKRHLHKIVRY